MAAPIDTANACSAEKMAAVQCVGMDTTGSCTTCGIQMETLGMIFPAEVNNGFMATQAYAVPGAPEYCTMSEETICTGYESSYSCCCQDPLAAWQNCIVEKELSVNMNIVPACTVSCGGGSDSKKGGGDGSSSMGIIVVVVVVILLIIGGLGGFFFYRRRRAKAIDQDQEEKKKGDKKNRKDYLFCFRQHNDDDDDDDEDDNDKKKKKRGNKRDDDDSYDARAIDEFDYEDEYDNDKKKKGNKMKKTPNSKKKQNTKKEKSGGNSSHSKTMRTDIEEGFSTRSLSSNSEERGGKDYDDYSRQDHQDDNSQSSSMSPEHVPSKSYRMKLSNNDDDYDDDDDDNYDNHNRSARDRKQDESRNNKNRKSARSIKTLEESDVSTLGSSSKQRLPKKISSKELKSIMKDREESSRRLMIMEDEMDEVTAKLDKKDRIKKNYKDKNWRTIVGLKNFSSNCYANDRDRRIEELEAQNRKLQLEVSGSQRNLGRTIDSTNDHDRGSSSNRYASSRSNKSKASMRVVHMNGEQGDDDHDEDSSLLSGSDNDIENEKFDKSRSGAARTPSSRSMRSSSHRSKSRERLSRDTNNENENMDKRRSVTKTPSSRSMRSSDHRSKSRERLSRDENPPPSKSLSRRSSSRERVQQDVDDDRQAALRSTSRSKSSRDPAPTIRTSSSRRKVEGKVRSGSSRALEQSSSHSRSNSRPGMNNSSRGSSRRSSSKAREEKY
eukprot:CAMPEP_0170867602 /NCGR_PEP_ID=MMETSP0734-20130129/22941_1 /TAXON_ID=186038 /ORGANISM="Fragilariopsis kerguelensis, Strain L26-C5" /LENGTH=721 /DNA_ID=CAMNT_0011244973 /DNA_START=67 /DNA_END=2233 /DNA_ORIENTATION=-